MPFIHPDRMDASYETVIIGSGFGSFFFLHEFLKYRRPGIGRSRTRLIQSTIRKRSIRTALAKSIGTTQLRSVAAPFAGGRFAPAIILAISV